MDLVYLVLGIALIGLLIHLITTLFKMPEEWARALRIGAAIVIVIYLISRFVPLPNVLPR